MHILIIPDGNRRWARARGLPEFVGHTKGSERFEEISRELFQEQKVEFLTFWVLSKDNIIKRSKFEIQALVKILEEKLYEELRSDKYERLGIRFRALGEWPILFQENFKLLELINLLQEKTKNYLKYNLTMLFGYDGFSEIINGIKQVAKNNLTNLDFETVHQNIWSKDLPEVDGVIRTGVENDPHNSGGVMMWLTGNSQFVFSATYFPDFTADKARQAVDEIKQRPKRLGK